MHKTEQMLRLQTGKQNKYPSFIDPILTALLYIKVTNTRTNNQIILFYFLLGGKGSHASNFLGNEPRANHPVTAAHLAFLFRVAAVDLKNTTIWRVTLLFSLKSLTESD